MEYERLTIDLRDDRWFFLNTLFSVSEGCLYAQLVDRLDSGELLEQCQPPFDYDRCSSYRQLHRAVSKALFKAHVQGKLKDEVMQDPIRFMNTDAAFPRTLLEQRVAGKKLALITNSDFVYTCTIMKHAYDPFLPDGMSWRDLFHVVVVSAAKPDFFTTRYRPVYEIVTNDGMMREAYQLKEGRIFAGGNAKMLEKVFGCSGKQVLYVGDHIFTDVNMAKRGLSWRTCLIMQELEAEVLGIEDGKERTGKVHRLYRQMDEQSSVLNYLETKLDSHRQRHGGMPNSTSRLSYDAMEGAVEQLRGSIEALEAEIHLLLWDDGAHVNKHWGYATRAGFADKSHLMRQIEKYADIYTSRVSNFQSYTPYKHFICGQQSLAHDRDDMFQHFKVTEI